MRLLRLPLAVALAMLLLCAQALATWSIVIVNTRTGEVCVASATCLPNFNLRKATPVVIPGVGVAAAQSYLDGIGNRLVIHNQMLNGLGPNDILDIIAARDTQLRLRQYGMVDVQGRALTFTGNGAGAWAGGVTGQVGDLVYAIQGNVLAGQLVVDDCEAAILNTPGDMADKVMAAMEAAHLAGGDGRCSCDPVNADRCGAPPPNFTHSAYCAYFLIARPGDPKKECDMNLGCGRGAFFLGLNIKNLGPNDPEPIGLLRAEYDTWRLDKAGKPDSVQSLVIPSTLSVSGGLANTVRYDIELYDIEGASINQGGATITLEHQDDSEGLASIQNVIDHQDGSYSVDVLTTADVGVERFAFRVDDGTGYTPLLWPPQELQITPPAVAPFSSLFVGPNSLPSDNLRAGFVTSGLPNTHYSLASLNPGDPVQLLRSEQTLVGFSQPTVVRIDGVPGHTLRDFWISADELRMHFTAVDPLDGVARIYRTERASIQSDFESPELCVGLNSDLGEMQPYLADHELEIYFITERIGLTELYRAERLSNTSEWFPAEKVMNVIPGVNRPVLTEGNQRMYLRSAASLREVRVLDRGSDGVWGDVGPLPTAAPGRFKLTSASNLSEWNGHTGSIWVLTETLVGTRWAQSLLGRRVLSGSQTEVSASVGGMAQYALNSFSFDSAQYEVIVGDPGSGARDLGMTLPIRTNRFTSVVRALAGQGSFSPLTGQLSGGSAAVDLNFRAGQLAVPGLIGRTLSVFAVLQDAQGTAFSNAAPFTILP